MYVALTVFLCTCEEQSVLPDRFGLQSTCVFGSAQYRACGVFDMLGACDRERDGGDEDLEGVSGLYVGNRATDLDPTRRYVDLQEWFATDAARILDQ